MKEALMKRLKEIGIIYLEPVKLKGGAISNYYVDVKVAYGYPDIMNMFIEEMWNIMDKKSNCVVAMGYGGVPLATALGLKYGLKVILVREEEKKYGKGGKIDGYIPTKDDYTTVVDDVTTTGGSLEEITEVIEPLTNITEWVVVVRRGVFDSKYPLKYFFEDSEFEEVMKIKSNE